MNSSEYVMSQQNVRYEWNETPWRKLEKSSFKLQKRIYRASKCNDIKKMHKLQRLLLKSTSARMLAVRRVTQDNRGKKTAGIDGKANLNQKERLQLACSLDIKEKQNHQDGSGSQNLVSHRNVVPLVFPLYRVEQNKHL
ncbi:reverse transcriptase N-terminal domain-containing protein [Wolbachia endosymbiont (group A) of Lasioglossum morio]|uniref:reverse transcriptase N-terminal domain-containing protein n=1 Tax=Wolbachia endosymbiont (group A) of Lasioglossum morio TaxID=2954025 RepID=UPI002226EDFC|nr:reverse transcriptase N-terminal domain-containing protein [Wolbachia endosymbiont (group A) of Lasioglossum morio]